MGLLGEKLMGKTLTIMWKHDKSNWRNCKIIDEFDDIIQIETEYKTTMYIERRAIGCYILCKGDGG